MDYPRLLIVHQTLLELRRARPEDEEIAAALAEAERQRNEAWEKAVKP